MNRGLRILKTGEFQKQARKILTEVELGGLCEFLQHYPERGDLIPGTGGLRKLRWASGGKGKRGGSRVIYYYQKPHNLLLLSVYAKNTKDDINSREARKLRELAEILLLEWSESGGKAH